MNYPNLMAIENILAQIDSEIERLKQARTLLATIDTQTTGGRAAKKVPAATKAKKKSHLSAAARKKIADAQRKRWAAVRAKAKAKA